MGVMTRGTLVSEALLIAGDTSLTSRANVWLNAWLRSVYRAWPWPFLHRRATAVALAAGTQSLVIGAGSGGITEEIQRVFDPIQVYNGGYSSRFTARIQPFLSDVELDQYALNPANNVGMPQFFGLIPDTAVWGKWTLRASAVPDRAYLLGFNYLIQPVALAADATIPIYPNDRTIIQAITADALKFMNDRRYAEALEILRAMSVEDRVKYGETSGINDSIPLDPSVFR